MKTCPRCGETKPTSAFGRNRSLADGLSFYCLSCNRERNNRWYRERRLSLGKEVRDLSWVPEGFRWCPVCRQAVAHADYVRSGVTASGFGSRCKACHNAANNDAYWHRKHGMSRTEVDALRVAQGDRCAICGDRDPQHLDHDHETGHVRQLLCQRCNHGRGLFRDDPYLLRVAAFYVEGHRQHQALTRLQESAGSAPGEPSRPGSPPVGSQRCPGPPRSRRSTGLRSSGERRQGAAGEADT
jgi:hypothetical protein